MILEFIHAFMRETDDGLTLKQVFQVILFNSRNFGLLLFTAVTPKSKFGSFVPCGDFAIFIGFLKVEA